MDNMQKKLYEDIEAGNEKIPVIWSGDVLVAGGGAAGVAAGAASARKRVKTMVIEKNSYLGGKVSDSPGLPIEGCFPGYISQGGIMDELCAKLRFAREDSAVMADVQGKGVSYYHENEYFKWLSEDILRKSGCCWKLGMTIENILVEGGRIKGIIAVQSMKKYAFLAKMVIDATGNGEIAKAAGLLRQNSDDTRFYYPYVLEDINTDILNNYLKEDRALIKARERAAKGGVRLGEEDNVEYLNTEIRGGKVYVDSIAVNKKIDMETEDLLETVHKKLFEHIQFYRRYVPGMEKAVLHRTGEVIRKLPGKIQGICQGHKEGYEENGRFQGILRMETETEGKGQMKLPLGMMIPQKMDNLLVTGKICDLDDDLREMIGSGHEMVLGQCAGICAAIAFLRGIMPKELEEEEIHSILDELGCDINGDLSRCCKGDKKVMVFSKEYREVEEK